MRLFVGVELPDATKAAAEAAILRLRTRLRRSWPKLDVRWIDPTNLHVTIWFLGEVDDTRAESITTMLGAPFETMAFDLTLGGFGAFPPSGPPRVLWLGIREGGNQLRALHGELAPRLTSLGFEAERREYSAHVTVGRVKEARGIRREELQHAMDRAAAHPAACHIAALTLFRSRLSPKGSKYEPVLRIPLS